MEGDRILAQSFSGPLGEFHLSYSSEQPPHLRMLVSDDRYIELDLAERRLG